MTPFFQLTTETKCLSLGNRLLSPLRWRLRLLGQGACMVPFAVSPHGYAEQFSRVGYVHIKEGVSEEFRRFATTQMEECFRTGERELVNREIKKKKKQYLFAMPDDDDFVRALVEWVAVVSGRSAELLTISERHIMVYDDDAVSFPSMHKDRLASEVALGIPLTVGAEARVALVPGRARAVNPLDNAVYRSCPVDPNAAAAEAGPRERYLKEEEIRYSDIVNLDVQPGDLVIFAGSSMYHGRLNASRSAALYFKFNAMRLDPLGEDPTTIRQRCNSMRMLDREGDALLASTVELSPRLQGIGQHYTRPNWASVIQVSIGAEGNFDISEDDLKFLLALRGRRLLKHVLLEVGVPEGKNMSDLPGIRRLISVGAIDLVGNSAAQ